MEHHSHKKPLLERLREKSEPEKRRFAFMVSLCVTLVIALIWLVSFMINLSSEPVENKSPTDQATTSTQVISPWASFKTQIGGFDEQN